MTQHHFQSKVILTKSENLSCIVPLHGTMILYQTDIQISLIVSFKHKGLKRLFEDDDRSKVQQEHVAKLVRMLAALDTAARVEELDAPGWAMHKLKGNLKDFYALKVSGNWRLIFRFDDGDFYDIDYLDYH